MKSRTRRLMLSLFSRDSFAIAVTNLVHEIKNARTKPTEIMLALVMLIQGVLYALPTDLFMRFQSFAIMSRLTSHVDVALWNIATGALLLFALLQQRVNTEKYIIPSADLPASAVYRLDSYFEVNALCLKLRRFALFSAVCWNGYAFVMFLGTVAYGPGWVYAFCFFCQSSWAIVRLRIDEKDSAWDIQRCRIESSQKSLLEEIGSMVRSITEVDTAKDNEADALDKSCRNGAMGCRDDDSASKTS